MFGLKQINWGYMMQRPVRLLGDVYMLTVSFFPKQHALLGQLIVTLARQLSGMFVITRRRYVNLTPKTSLTTTTGYSLRSRLFDKAVSVSSARQLFIESSRNKPSSPSLQNFYQCKSGEVSSNCCCFHKLCKANQKTLMEKHRIIFTIVNIA